MEKLVLIDGNSLINRAFYAMPLLTTKDGTPTNAVYGFMNMFFKMLAEERPTHAAVAFDLKAPTFRHKMYPEYKGTRKPMPDELRPQIPLLKELLVLMGITVVEKEGSEADDIIGTIAKHTHIKTLIFTGDKDAFQLVDEETEVHFTKRGITEVEVYDSKNFKEKTGIDPVQVIELKALMGDHSDNIPGISGIGEKTALSLVKTYGTVKNLFEHADEIKGKLGEKIAAGKDSAELSKVLATIDTNCGVDTDVTKMRINLPFPAAVRKRFGELEFKTLFKRDDLFEEEDKKEEVSISPKANVITAENLSEVKFIQPPVSVYLSAERIDLYDGKNEYVFKIRDNLLGDGFALSEVLKVLEPVFCDKKRLVVFNKKDFCHYLAERAGYDLAAPCDDVSIMKYLADFTGRSETADEALDDAGYSAKDTPAADLYRLYEELGEKLKAENMYSLYSDVELPLSDVLFNMEVSGFKVDVEALYRAGAGYTEIMNDLETKIKLIAGDDSLNVNSPKQLGDLLFEKLKIGKSKKTKKGYSTTAEILESLESAHPIVPMILRYRQVQKLYSTYIEGFKPLIDKATGLIHTSFNQTVTATGRLSSKEPNLQNIPVRDDEGKELRKFFVPRDDDHVLVGADYSQIELRLLAAFSNCEGLIKAFREGADVHAATAAKVFGVPISGVTSHMRSSAKAVNFGIIYGISEYGLARNLKISNAKARDYIDAYFKEYPEVKAYMEKNVALAKEKGYAETLLGRRRYIRELAASSYNVRQFGERVAMNMPLQGSSADIIKLAMLGVSKRLKEENLKSELILQIHDELIIDAVKEEQERVEKILVEEMEGAVKLSVPLTVSLGSGKTWFDAK